MGFGVQLGAKHSFSHKHKKHPKPYHTDKQTCDCTQTHTLSAGSQLTPSSHILALRRSSSVSSTNTPRGSRLATSVSGNTAWLVGAHVCVCACRWVVAHACHAARLMKRTQTEWHRHNREKRVCVSSGCSGVTYTQSCSAAAAVGAAQENSQTTTIGQLYKCSKQRSKHKSLARHVHAMYMNLHTCTLTHKHTNAQTRTHT